jgi:hypothetical protein
MCISFFCICLILPSSFIFFLALLFKTVDVINGFPRGSTFTPGVNLLRCLSCFGLNFGAFTLLTFDARASDLSFTESFIGVAALKFIF